MNALHIGFEKLVSPPEKGLFIHDEIPDIELATVFNPKKHFFNPLKNIDYRKACDLVSIFTALFPSGENTLTKEGVPDVLLEALLEKPKKLSELLDRKSADPKLRRSWIEELGAMRDRIAGMRSLLASF